MQGAWIEIFPVATRLSRRVSLPVQGAWIEIGIFVPTYTDACRSLPVQGAWIEIVRDIVLSYVLCVAPRAGSVD